METRSNSIIGNIGRVDSNTTDSNNEEYDDQRQAIREFIATAERIVSSRTSPLDEGMRISTSSDAPIKRRNHPTNDSFLPQEQKNFHNIDPLEKEVLSIPSEYDENIVRAVIAHDEKLNREVTELFGLDRFVGMDSYLASSSDDPSKSDSDSDDCSDDDCKSCDQLRDCLSRCMFIQ